MYGSNVPRNAAQGRPRRVSRSAGHKRPGRKPHSWKRRLAIGAVAAGLALVVWAVMARSLVARSNTLLTHFDAIIVLGAPADSDGNPTPIELARVTEAVHEYQKGVAPRLIFTGGATRHGFVEARVMAHAAEAQGIPESAVLMEPEAKDTIQNACYSVRMMKAHGWHSAEIISSDFHLPRVALIFNSLPLDWSTHAASPLSPASAAYEDTHIAVEVLKTARYLIWARWADRCAP